MSCGEHTDHVFHMIMLNMCVLFPAEVLLTPTLEYQQIQHVHNSIPVYWYNKMSRELIVKLRTFLHTFLYVMFINIRKFHD